MKLFVFGALAFLAGAFSPNHNAAAMKTITQVNLQISNAMASAESTTDKKAIKELKKRLSLLRAVLKYLETDPSEDFIQRQFLYVEKKIVQYKKMHLEAEGKLPDIRKAFIKELNKEFEITKLRKQRIVLDFILEGDYVPQPV